MGEAADTAYASIKEMILGGTLAPNSLVEEGKIAESLGVSRTPVREGLLRLSSESLVEIGRGKGIRVLPLSIDDMRETYQAISGLEMVAISLLAEAPRPREKLEPLSDAVNAMRLALDNQDAVAWSDADEVFHRELLRLSDNKRLHAVGCQLRDFARRAHRIAVRLQDLEYKQISTDAHAGLVEQLIAGGVDEAWANHMRQRRRGEEALVGIVSKLGLRTL